MTPLVSRRRLLWLAGAVPAAFAVARAAAADAPASCADPANLSLSVRARRRSLGYAEPGPDPKRRCAGCAFFAGTASGCGACQLMSGAPVAAAGVCNSFAAKAG